MAGFAFTCVGSETIERNSNTELTPLDAVCLQGKQQASHWTHTIGAPGRLMHLHPMKNPREKQYAAHQAKHQHDDHLQRFQNRKGDVREWRDTQGENANDAQHRHEDSEKSHHLREMVEEVRPCLQIEIAVLLHSIHG